jgi:putative transcriptional regulator
MLEPASSILLIAEPFLKDPSFSRTVVLICKHDDEEGTFGFVLSRKLDTTLDEIITDMENWELPVYLGGPVHTDTLHYIHQYPQYFDDAVKIAENVYWGGDFEKMKSLIKDGTLDPNKIKFFLGYSGWSENQLRNEIDERSWITCQSTKKLIFETEANNIWNMSLTELGGKYKMMVHFPTDPQLN